MATSRVVTHAEEGALYDEHAAQLKRIARNFAAQHATDIDDAEQNGGIGLLKAIRTFDASLGVPFSAWACQSMRRAMYDGLRRERVQASRRTGYDRVQFIDIDAPARNRRGDSVIETIAELQCDDGADVRSDIAAAIETLPPQWQRTLKLYYFEGHSHAEIAEILARSRARVAQILNASQRKLRERFISAEFALARVEAAGKVEAA